MSIVFAESVAITKSRLVKGFNGDNLNLNGKVVSMEEADAGFKAAGNVKPPYIAVVASGNQKGFASGAATAFNDYVKDIHLNKYNAEAVIGRYFDDMQAVVEKCDLPGSKLSVGIVCVYDDCVIAAKTGDCHILRFSDGELFEIALSDDEGGRGYQFVDVVNNGDMFALIGEEASADLDYDSIVNSFDTGADLKEMIKEFYRILSANAKGKDCTVVLMKLSCDEERTYAAAPLAVAADDADVSVSPDKFAVEPPVSADELRENDSDVSDEDAPETGKKTVSSKKKLLSFIPVAILVIIIAVTVALHLATRPSNPLGGFEGNSDDNSPIFNEGESFDDDFNGSNGMQSVDDTEYGGSVDAPEEDDNTTTTEPERQTQQEKPTEAEKTTDAETTTADDETTTADDETTTTDGSEDTTAETTTAETTEAPADEPADEPEEGNDEPANAEPAGDTE